MPKLSKVTIRNFRNYVGVHEIVLAKRVTILYGANGYGKSSFFDALEWCLSGRISRFDDADGFSKSDIATRYNDEPEFECAVEMQFDTFSVTRSFTIRDGEPQQTNVQCTIHGRRPVRGANSVQRFLSEQLLGQVDNTRYADLVKHTHILSQDQVTDFIVRDKPEERFEVFAEILGLKSLRILSQNTRAVVSKLQSRKRELQRQRQQLVELEVSQKESQLAVDVQELKTMVRGFGIEWDSISLEELRQRLVQHNFDVESKIKSEAQLQNFVSVLREEGYASLYDVLQQIQSLRHEIEKHDTRLKSLETIQQQLSDRVAVLKDAQEYIKSVQEITSSLGNADSEIRSLGFDPNLSMEAFELGAQLAQDRVVRLDYAISHKPEYDRLQGERRAFFTNQTRIEASLEHQTRRESRLRSVLNVLNDRLENTGDGSLEVLLRSLKDLHSYVQTHDTNGHCPACSSFVGQGILEHIRSNVVSLDKVVGQQQGTTKRIMSYKVLFERRLELSIEKRNNLRATLQADETAEKQRAQRINKISIHAQFDASLFTSPLTNLKNSRAQESHNLDKLSRMIELVLHKQSLQRELRVLNARNIDSQWNLEHVVGSRNRLQRGAVKVATWISKRKKLRTDIVARLKVLESHEYRITDSFNENQLHTTLGRLADDVSGRLNVVTMEHQFSKKILEDLNRLEFNQNNSSVIDKTRGKINEINTLLQKLDAALSSADSFAQLLQKEVGENAQDTLNRTESRLQKYYRYLNPLPSSHYIHFSGDEATDILVPLGNAENQRLMGAHYALSSGQLNVLALSIFLAINQSSEGGFKFAGIDDPIQNMDDVNRFSVCDILSDLDGQLVFSTHDLDFVKLFVKKNEHRKSELQVLIFDGPKLFSGNVRTVFND